MANAEPDILFDDSAVDEFDDGKLCDYWLEIWNSL